MTRVPARSNSDDELRLRRALSHYRSRQRCLRSSVMACAVYRWVQSSPPTAGGSSMNVRFWLSDLVCPSLDSVITERMHEQRVGATSPGVLKSAPHTPPSCSVLPAATESGLIAASAHVVATSARQPALISRNPLTVFFCSSVPHELVTSHSSVTVIFARFK